ncbi:MAG TPA: substrate-binding protein [Solirubrobacterales bacterium]|nr:substrate-binding protein [Solirubrobacterales bacterium]
MVFVACGDDNGDDAAEGGDGETIKIGVLAPITGELAPYGEALERGMTVGANLINQDGGIDGRQVEWVLADDQTEPRAAATQARRLLTQENVDVLMGTTSSATTLAAIPFAEQAQKPFFYVVEGEIKTCDASGEAPRRYIFGNGESPEQKMEEFIPYMLDRFGEDVYFIGSDYVFPQFINEIVSGIVEDNGGNMIGDAFVPLGTSEFSSYIADIRRANPDILFIGVVGTDGVSLVQQINQFGLDGVTLTGIPTFANEVLPGIAPVAQGVFTVDRYWEQTENPVNREFVQAYEARYGDEAPVPTIGAQGAYGTLLLLQQAAEEAGSIDGEALADALPGTSVQSPAGEITINPDNHVVEGPIRVLRIEGDGYELVEEFDNVPHPGFSGCSSQDL